MFAWLRKLFASSQRTPAVPSVSARVVRLLITAADEIRLEDKPISLTEFQAVLPQYAGKDVVICYQREHPELLASSLAMEVVQSICRLGLAIAFPPEAKPTIDALMYERGEGTGQA